MDNTRPLKKIRFKVEKSEFPDREGTHLLIVQTASEYGWGYRRLFKGTKQECLEKKKEMESKYVSKK